MVSTDQIVAGLYVLEDIEKVLTIWFYGIGPGVGKKGMEILVQPIGVVCVNDRHSSFSHKVSETSLLLDFPSLVCLCNVAFG